MEVFSTRDVTLAKSEGACSGVSFVTPKARELLLGLESGCLNRKFRV